MTSIWGIHLARSSSPRGLGYELPQYAHIPPVAEPGSRRKLSKRKIATYLKNRDFAKLYQLGADIAERIGLETSPESFNPVLVEFYRETGFIADAIVNYMLLVGWSLDDKTENFTREEMLQHFSIDRVVKAAASFDSLKLIAFQQRYMNELSLDEKVDRCAPFLVSAGLLDTIDDSTREYLSKIIKAADDRIAIAGDILNFDDFFSADDELVYEEKAFQKRLIKPDDAGFLLAEFRKLLVAEEDYSAENLEQLLKGFCETQEIKIGQIINALRVAISGKGVGFSTFDSMEILGKERVLARTDHTLGLLQSGSEV